MESSASCTSAVGLFTATEARENMIVPEISVAHLVLAVNPFSI